MYNLYSDLSIANTTAVALILSNHFFPFTMSHSMSCLGLSFCLALSTSKIIHIVHSMIILSYNVSTALQIISLYHSYHVFCS